MFEQVAGVHRFWIQLPGEVPRRLVHRLRYTQVGLGILVHHMSCRQVTRVFRCETRFIIAVITVYSKGIPEKC